MLYPNKGVGSVAISDLLRYSINNKKQISIVIGSIYLKRQPQQKQKQKQPISTVIFAVG
ncbi:MAG: hypothetical protein ACTHKK_03670 [Candidatus Nitrosocosmicus sp.]